MAGHLPIGSAVAGYRLIALVGEGATGTVYLAEREGTSDRVALKLLDPELARNERFRQRLIRESTIASSLNHPHTVPVLDFGEAEGTIYLAMRYVDGSDLRELLAREGPLDPDRALALLAQVADALDEAHARGLIHRDVKPANILIESADDGEHVFLGDFGLAKYASSVSSLTSDQAFVGTIAYVSPEQIRGEEIDSRADVYSLGCVLYECLAGAPPFARDSELAVVYAHLHERAPPLTDVRPELPDGIDGVIRTATAKSPGDRFSSCAELIAAARFALAGGRVRRRHLRAGAAVGVVAALGAIAASVIALTHEAGGGMPPAGPRLDVGGSNVALVDTRTHRVAARIGVPEPPADIVFGGRSAWALLRGSQRVVQIDIPTRKQVGGTSLPFTPGGIALAGDALFVTEQGGPGLIRIATRTRRISARWTVPTRGIVFSDPTGVAAGAGSVWLARGAQVVRVDASSGRVLHRFPLPVTATLLTFADGALWAASSSNGLVEKIDPARDVIAERAALHGWISALTVAGGSVWAAVTPDDVVYRLNEDDASVEQTTNAGDGPESLSAGSGVLWVANARGRTLTGTDMRSGDRTDLPLTGEPELVRQHGDFLWTAGEPPPPLGPAKNGPVIRVAVHDDELDLDPAVGPYPTVSQLLYSTCAKLLNYPDATGTAGGRLSPDAAVALPTVSPDGRTYTFQIRRGIRFSPPSTEQLTAQTFKHSIERTLSPKVGPDPPGLHAVGDIEGARAFYAGQAGDVRGIVADGDRLSITLVRPAGDLPSRLAMPLFCAVPSGTPAPGAVRRPIPSAGPYYVSYQGPTQTVLDRNPNYRGPRPNRPARIVYMTGLPTAKSVALADGNRVDVVTWDYDTSGPLAPGGSLARRFGTDPVAARRDGSPRYHVAAAPGVDMVAFNTKRPLFRDARLRRAVNDALDRKALAAVFDETPIDRYVPPAVPGVQTPAVYPLDRPDLASALKLVGKRRRRFASIYVCGEPANMRVAQIISANLRPLGIHVSITESLGCLQGIDPKARDADMILITRATAELDPQPFLESTIGQTSAFGPGGGLVTWTDRTFRHRLDRARTLTAPRRLAAYARLQDDLLRGPAPYAAYGSFVAPEYFSARVRCRLIQGAYRVVDLGALCLDRS
jgi:ABC-type transport system substrate-binding protein/tRNA A-37 threonylcarbamoyl transferase component Bud32